VGAVVVGFDMNINYRKLARAYTYLLNPDCLFIGTNTDTAYPFHGRTFPGTGTFVAAVAACSKRQPLIMGKPHPTMLECIVENLHLDPKRTCMVGDRLDTDIRFGQHGGMGTLLVMTGITTPEILKESSIHPDYVVDRFVSLRENSL
jgi:4-nitrophenyl phosphatase